MIEYFQQYVGKYATEFPAPPFTRWLNVKLEHIATDELTASLLVRPEMANPVGMLHGGIHAAILDDMIGLTVAASGLPNLYVSVNLSVDFLQAAKVGDTVTAKIKIARKGKTIVNIVGELWAENGTLLSRATSNMANTGQPPFMPPRF